MAMTASVKDELSRVDVSKPCCRRAEMAALLRFAGGLHIVSGGSWSEAELDTGATARRLRREIAEVYGYPSEFHVLASGGLRKGSHYIVRVVKDGEALARQTGLLDVRGRPVRACRRTSSRPALLRRRRLAGRVPGARSLTEPGRSCALEITCPGPESALALVGALAHRVAAKAREVRGVDRVVVKDGDAIARCSPVSAAHASVLSWEEARVRREVRATPTLANFDDANLRRSARAQVAASARVTRALEILGSDARGTSPAPVCCGWSTSRPPWRSWARWPTAADQGRDRRPHPPAAGPGRQAGPGSRNSRHRVRGHRRHARQLSVWSLGSPPLIHPQWIAVSRLNGRSVGEDEHRARPGPPHRRAPPTDSLRFVRRWGRRRPHDLRSAALHAPGGGGVCCRGGAVRDVFGRRPTRAGAQRRSRLL
jgi:DNA-binding protein WhiA